MQKKRTQNAPKMNQNDPNSTSKTPPPNPKRPQFQTFKNKKIKIIIAGAEKIIDNTGL
jgi:hypothetical protein